MISTSKTTLRLNNLKILRPKVMKNLMNLLKKFFEFPSMAVDNKVNLSWAQSYKTFRRIFRRLTLLT